MYRILEKNNSGSRTVLNCARRCFYQYANHLPNHVLSIELLELWTYEVEGLLEFFEPLRFLGLLGLWAVGFLGLWSSGNLGRWVLRDFRSLGFWVVRYLGLSGPLGFWVSGSLGPCVPGSLGLWVYGSLGLWASGSLGLWVFGSLGRQSIGYCSSTLDGKSNINMYHDHRVYGSMGL